MEDPTSPHAPGAQLYGYWAGALARECRATLPEERFGGYPAPPTWAFLLPEQKEAWAYLASLDRWDLDREPRFLTDDELVRECAVTTDAGDYGPVDADRLRALEAEAESRGIDWLKRESEMRKERAA